MAEVLRLNGRHFAPTDLIVLFAPTAPNTPPADGPSTVPPADGIVADGMAGDGIVVDGVDLTGDIEVALRTGAGLRTTDPAAALAAGVPPDTIVYDAGGLPGAARLRMLVADGWPVLVNVDAAAAPSAAAPSAAAPSAAAPSAAAPSAAVEGVSGRGELTGAGGPGIATGTDDHGDTAGTRGHGDIPGAGGHGDTAGALDPGDATAAVAAASVCAWLGARVFATRHPAEVRQALDLVAIIRGDRPPAVSRRGLA